MTICFRLVYLSDALLILDRAVEVEHSDDLEGLLSHLGVRDDALRSSVLVVLLDLDALSLEVVVQEPV